NPAKLPQELLGTFSTSSQTKVEDHGSPRPTVLPQVGLMIVPSPIAHLHRHRRFIGLQEASPQQFVLHGPDHRHQHLPYLHHPTIHRRTAQLQPRFLFQGHALPVQWKMFAVLADQRLDHYAIADQPLFDDPLRDRRRPHSASTAAAGSLLSLAYLYEI